MGSPSYSASQVSIETPCARRDRLHRTWLGALLYLVTNRRLHREDPRAFHGYRPGADDADLLRQQRDLSDTLDAVVVQAISRLNPLPYEVDGLRAFMLRNGVSTIGIGLDFLVLITVFAGLVAIAARLYPRMGE